MADLYEEYRHDLQILGLNYDKLPKPTEITAQFRKLSLKMHPDKGGKKEDFQQLSESFHRLSSCIVSRWEIFVDPEDIEENKNKKSEWESALIAFDKEAKITPTASNMSVEDEDGIIIENVSRKEEFSTADANDAAVVQARFGLDRKPLHVLSFKNKEIQFGKLKDGVTYKLPKLEILIKEEDGIIIEDGSRKEEFTTADANDAAMIQARFGLDCKPLHVLSFKNKEIQFGELKDGVTYKLPKLEIPIKEEDGIIIEDGSRKEEFSTADANDAAVVQARFGFGLGTLKDWVTSLTTYFLPKLEIPITTKKRLAIKMKEESRLVEVHNGLKIYTPKQVDPMKTGNVEKYSIGKEVNTATMTNKEKVIMVVGTTGSGKSTFLNSMVNYAFDVNHDDDFRFKIIDIDKNHKELSAKSVTKKVTAYVLNETKFGFKFTIVDTPGFGDTDGLKEDKKTTGLIKELFETSGPGGITTLDAVCLVVKSTDTRLTAAMKHNLNSVFQLFAKDMVNNVSVVATFCDAAKPPVIETLKAHEVKYNDLTKVNNSAFFEAPTCDDEDEKQAQAFHWKVGITGFDKFFKNLKKRSPVSLQLSAKVLQNRDRLENLVMQIQQNIKYGISHLETMREEAKIIEKHAADIAANKDFTYVVKEMKYEEIPITDVIHFTTTCMKDTFTCHNHCAYKDDIEKWKCCMMDSNGNCTACPCKGSWNLHKNVPFLYERRLISVTKSFDDLKAKYNAATDEKNKKEHMMNGLGEKFGSTQMDIQKAVQELKTKITELEKIAACPRYLSDVDYIDLLIRTEEDEAHPGWKERVTHLRKQRDLAVTMTKAKNPNYDPFQEYKKEGGKSWGQYIKKHFSLW